MIFAGLLYILVPALLLWLNHESALRSQFIAPQLCTHTSTDDPQCTDNTNPIQKASDTQVMPAIKKLESKQTQLDYHQLTIRQLKTIARKRKIKRYSSMRKKDLIFALTS